MNHLKKNLCSVGALVLVMGALLLSVGLTGSGCETAADNFDSRVACRHYCDKEFDCNDDDPTSGEFADCVSDCRESIEDNCGNENQGEANDKIEECVDKSCINFWACMVFDVAPECFGFVDQD
jgi:hypothetical protein